MTKEEFLSMVDKEIDNLEQEKEAYASKLIDYETEKGKSSQFMTDDPEWKRINYLREVVDRKIFYLNEHLHQPAYERVQVMSDLEIEKYKQTKIEGLELEIKEIEVQRKEAEEELKKLTEEQSKLIMKGENLTQNEEIRKTELLIQIDGLTKKFAEFENEMQNDRNRKEQIKGMSSEEVKKQMISKINGNYQRKAAQKPSSEFEKLQAEVAKDPEKAQQMARLMTRYAKLNEQQVRVQMDLPILKNMDSKSSQIAKNIMSRNGYQRLINPDNENDFKKGIEVINRVEKGFEQAKKEFETQFTEEKLSKITRTWEERHDKTDNYEVDVEFLKLHQDKIPKNEFNLLMDRIETRKRLQKKLIKTKKTKNDIDTCNYHIQNEQERIYREIEDWYRDKLDSWECYGMNSKISFFDPEDLAAELESCKGRFGKIEQEFVDLKKGFEEAQKKAAQHNKGLEDRKNELAQQMETLGDGMYKDTIKEQQYMSTDVEQNLKEIQSQSGFVYSEEMMNKVQQEAQKQADTREAQLREIPVEQLLQNRQQPQNQS